MRTTQATNRTRPLIIHKGVVIGFLREHPEHLCTILPGYRGTVAKAIRELEGHTDEWIVDGVLGGTDR